MKKVINLSFLILMLACPALLYAQGTRDLHSLKSTKASGKKDLDTDYFIMNDTLFACKYLDNMKIALADIDFSATGMAATGSLENETKKPVFSLLIKPAADKIVYEASGLMSLGVGSDRRTEAAKTPMYIYIAGKEEADNELNRFKSLSRKALMNRYDALVAKREKLEKDLAAMPKSSTTDDSKADEDAFEKMLDDAIKAEDNAPKNSTAELLNDLKQDFSLDVNSDKTKDTKTDEVKPANGRTEEVKAAMAKIFNTDDNDAKPAQKATVATRASGNFDSQLAALMNGAKNGFKDLKGSALIGTDDFFSRVQLAGAEKTEIVTGMLKTVAVVAFFGEFTSEAEALPVYKKVIEDIQKASDLPAMMIKLDEKSNSAVRITPMAPFGGPDELKDMLFYIELAKSFKFDKAMNKTDMWFVTFRIEP